MWLWEPWLLTSIIGWSRNKLGRSLATKSLKNKLGLSLATKCLEKKLGLSLATTVFREISHSWVVKIVSRGITEQGGPFDQY